VLILVFPFKKIQNTAFTSFSTLGLAIILVVGGIIVTVFFSIEPIIDCLERRNGGASYQSLEWSSNCTLQLQRLAQEGVGNGIWSGAVGTNPVTEDGDLLGYLDISKPAHPLLVQLDSGKKSDSLA